MGGGTNDARSPLLHCTDNVEEPKKGMSAAHAALLGKFTELAFDEAAETRWQESRPAEADNIDVGPATETDLQGDLMEALVGSVLIPPQRLF